MQHQAPVDLVEGAGAAFDGFVPFGTGLVGVGVAGQDPLGLEAAQICQDLAVAAHVEAIFVDVVGKERGPGLEGHAAGGPEEDLVAGMGDAFAVDFHTHQGGKAGVAGHGVEGDGDIFPVDGCGVGQVAADGDGLVPQAGPVVAAGVFEDVGKVRPGPHLGAADALQQGDAVDVVVVEVSHQGGVDALDSQVFFESSQTCQPS